MAEDLYWANIDSGTKEITSGTYDATKEHSDDVLRAFHGPAFGDVFEHPDGTLWIENGEYLSQVNFCPLTGKEARTKIVPCPEKGDG